MSPESVVALTAMPAGTATVRSTLHSPTRSGEQATVIETPAPLVVTSMVGRTSP